MLAGVAFLVGGDVFGRAGGDDLTAFVAAVGTEIDNPVGGFDHFHVVLDDDDGVAGVDQLVQHFEQFFNVFEMQPGCRFV